MLHLLPTYLTLPSAKANTYLPRSDCTSLDILRLTEAHLIPHRVYLQCSDLFRDSVQVLNDMGTLEISTERLSRRDAFHRARPRGGHTSVAKPAHLLCSRYPVPMCPLVQSGNRSESRLSLRDATLNNHLQHVCLLGFRRVTEPQTCMVSLERDHQTQLPECYCRF
ncbi:hypothetical protein F4823DRAFT_53565 [Ustulina deusta]|nr:hypothetical protein F4823DRAFT_53565 [Ustulina deusta]